MTEEKRVLLNTRCPACRVRFYDGGKILDHGHEVTIAICPKCGRKVLR